MIYLTIFFIVFSSFNFDPGFGRYLLLSNGELHIINATKLDAGAYRCQTRHQLTNEVLTSAVAGRLIVTGKCTIYIQ